jgi:NADH-quinone oxidoreductase subunit L
MTRLVVLTFHGSFRGPRERSEAVHESPFSMTSALIVLAVLAAIGGYLGVPAVLGGSNAFGRYLTPVVGHHAMHMEHADEIALMIISVAVALVGIFVAARVYRFGPGPDETFRFGARGVHATLSNAYFVDAAYDRGIVAGVARFSIFLWRFVDMVVIDGIANGVAQAARAFGDSWRRWSTGNVQQYAMSVLIGVVILVVAFAIGAAR